MILNGLAHSSQIWSSWNENRRTKMMTVMISLRTSAALENGVISVQCGLCSRKPLRNCGLNEPAIKESVSY
jgi:hypothetical protein